jgi:hypothetical protein
MFHVNDELLEDYKINLDCTSWFRVWRATIILN